MEYGPRPRPVFFGLALITVGVLFLLRELDVLPDISGWTLFWLGLGGWLFVGTLAGRRRKGWFWPLTLLAIGVFMLLRDLEAIPDDFSIWPVVVIAIGLSMTLEARDSRKGDEDIQVFGPGS
ncbi:MAG TPA: DUF5668 domain-containing protein, partial [Acidimicrobiia bacterium]|nr:DUF5668 domain-containing protein [Acidimicrobiia bacterium]